MILQSVRETFLQRHATVQNVATHPWFLPWREISGMWVGSDVSRVGRLWSEARSWALRVFLLALLSFLTAKNDKWQL